MLPPPEDAAHCLLSGLLQGCAFPSGIATASSHFMLQQFCKTDILSASCYPWQWDWPWEYFPADERGTDAEVKILE